LDQSIAYLYTWYDSGAISPSRSPTLTKNDLLLSFSLHYYPLVYSMHDQN